jgi:AraC-like DNA-binding protein
LFGQQQEVTNRYVGKDFLVFQIVFRPGALFRLTGIPSHEITNQSLDAETVFPSYIKEVNEQLFHSPDFKTMIQVVEKFLIKAAAKQQKEVHRLDQVSNQVLTMKEVVSVDWMAKESYLSNRQLERKFLDRMGVTPKYFSRLVRFENAFRMKNQFPDKDWLSIAIHCGYHDYQHLVKEYQEFTGKTPTEFHLLDSAGPERQFGVADTY